MSNNQAPRDANNVPVQLGYDPAGHQVATVQVTGVATDATNGVVYGVAGGNLAQIGGVATQMATADSVAQANVPMFAVGLWNSNSGGIVDRLRDAGSIGDGVTIGLIAAQQMLFNGGSADRLRTPTTFVPIAAVAITAGTPVAVWTPTGGRKFHLMGYCVASTVNSSIIFENGSGNEIFRVPVLAGAPQTNPGNFGNGYAGTVANQALYFDVTSSGTVSGFVFGTAEF